MSPAPQPTSAQEFTSTRWSEILAACTSSPQRRQDVLDHLARRYWKPVYSYLRAKGHQDADARDLTQDFFVEVILIRDLFGQAEQARGRFRAYLLHCLKNYLRDRHRRDQAQRRSPDRPMVSIDQWADSEHSRYQPPAPGTSPEGVFHHKWAVSLLEHVLDGLTASCNKSGLGVHLHIFEQRFIRPALEQVPPAPLEELAERHGLTPKQAANRAETIRRRFRRLLLDEVRFTVADDSVAEEELRSLMGHLRSRSG